MRSARRWIAAAAMVAASGAQAEQLAAMGEPAPDSLAAGRAIYLEGRLSSGEPVWATRPGGTSVSAAAAACVQCHQRSGMGLSEGAILVPPISGPALFRNELPGGHVPRRAPGMEFKDYPFRTRPPYDEAGLARAIRDGVSPTGHEFQYMMPRYALAEADMNALIAYLRTLSAEPSPGADASVAHFATVVAPGADPERRDAYLGVLKACFAERYPEAVQDSSVQAQSGKRQVWRLHLWELRGEPETWESQLAGKYAEQPVFALVSGLGADEWAPVEGFCETSALPCLFPNVSLPGTAGTGRYSFYFSRGVLLEADVLAGYVKAQRQDLALQRVVQLVSREGAGARAAAAFSQALAGTGMAIETRAVDGASVNAALLKDVGKRDALVLWVKEADLAELAGRIQRPPPAGLVLLSGIMSGLEDAPLSSPWRKAAVMAYPYDPPGRWHLRMDRNLRPWLAKYNLPRSDERVQGNTLAACNLLTESMLRLRGTYVRDYLVEWLENYPTAMGNAPAPQAYPRFSLGPGQRFSSKGAYLVRFASPAGRRLEPVLQDWIIP